jgi:preprotein translocase subunit SecD
MQIALWKRIIILGLCALGVFFAVPNLFYTRVENHNDAVKKIAQGATTPDLQAKAAGWPSWLPSDLVNLGLDLRGGAHLLAEVQLKDVYADRMNALWPEVRDALRADRGVVGNVRREPSPPDQLRVSISEAGGLDKAVADVQALSQPVVSLTGVGQRDIQAVGAGNTITISMSPAEKTATDDRTMQQSLEIVRRRVDAAGTREPTIQREGTDRILIEVPGIGSADELKALIGTTARLTFNGVLGRTADPHAIAGAGNVVLPSQDEKGVYYIVQDTPVVTGEDLTDAQPAFDQNGRPAVDFRFDASGARKFGDYTAQHIGSPFAIVLDNQVISAPVIQAHIGGGSGIITGNFTVAGSTKLAVLLRAGALPAKMNFLEERTIGPELGADSIKAGKIAAVAGSLAVGVFMVLVYGWFGWIANFSLLLNLGMMFGALSMIGGTLTLPGIAGIVLTVGTAVDGNVLVYERIREELRNAKGPARAIELGYDRALSAIVDSNITTMISALILYFVGSGPVRGFAVTLALGIMTSVFSTVFLSRLFIVMWFERRRPKTIEV